MASADNPRQPIPPAVRRRLQAWFESGSKAMASGNFDYATQSFSQCVKGDPANALYIQNFLGNLAKKYNNNKSGAKFSGIKGATSKGQIKKSMMQKDWPNVIDQGIDLLHLNPWDTGVLGDIAVACHNLGFDDAELAYLKMALDADIKDPEVNRQMGRALQRQGMFDQAMICWNRVKQAKPEDDEARRSAADCSVEKTIIKGEFDTATSTTDVMADKQARADRTGQGAPRFTPEQLVERAIAKDPTDISKYEDLADLHMNQERYEEAEKVLARALEASGGDVRIREKLEDAQLRRVRQQVSVAEKQAKAEKTTETIHLWNEMREELNNKEIEIFRNRVERYPATVGYKYELAVRLQKKGNFREAIKYFQGAMSDTKQRGKVFMNLGLCFHQEKQPKLALDNFEKAIVEIGDRDLEEKKRALYNAGVMAQSLKDRPKASQYLGELASLDYGYKDVADRLAKLDEMDDNS